MSKRYQVKWLNGSMSHQSGVYAREHEPNSFVLSVPMSHQKALGALRYAIESGAQAELVEAA